MMRCLLHRWVKVRSIPDRGGDHAGYCLECRKCKKRKYKQVNFAVFHADDVSSVCRWVNAETRGNDDRRM